MKRGLKNSQSKQIKCLTFQKREVNMDFWTELIKIVVSNGVFAMLFVFLFFYQLKDSSRREKEYCQTINGLMKHLEMIEEVKEDISILKDLLTEKENEDF